MMASLDDAERTTNLYRNDVGHSSDSHPSHRFQRRECGTQKLGSQCLGHWRNKKADDVIAYSGPDDKLGKSSFSEAARKSKAFEAVVYPLAPMEPKVEIPEGREAWIDHRLHTDRAR